MSFGSLLQYPAGERHTQTLEEKEKNFKSSNGLTVCLFEGVYNL